MGGRMGKGRSAVAEAEDRKEFRWSVRKKTDAVIRLLRGEDLDELSRELRVEAHRLAAWRDEFLAAGTEGLKASPTPPEERRLREAERKIGELTMENEILGMGLTRLCVARHSRGSPKPRPGARRSPGEF